MTNRIVASVDQFPLDLARSAFEHNSHTPDRRAQGEAEGYVRDVQSLFDEGMKIAVEEGQVSVLVDAVERYRVRYLQKIAPYYYAMSHTASAFITGPAKFPVRKNRKHLEAADKRFAEFSDWREKARAATLKSVRLAASPEQVAADEWKALQVDIGSSLKTIAGIDAGDLLGYDRALFVSSIAGKLKRLATSGQVQLVERALAYITDQQAGMPKPAFTARHRIWTLRAEAEKAGQLMAEKASREAEETELFGVRIVRDFADERIRLFFPSKPDEPVRAALRSSGWKWSPSNEAWQRKLTQAAIWSAEGIIHRYYAEVE